MILGTFGTNVAGQINVLETLERKDKLFKCLSLEPLWEKNLIGFKYSNGLVYICK